MTQSVFDHRRSAPAFLEPGSGTAFAHTVAYRLGKLAERGILRGDWLDCGCAEGGYAIALARAGATSVAGVDADENRVRVARGRPRGAPVTFQCASATALPYADESFDAVLLNEVLEHVDDEDAVLSEIWRVLRAEGHLAIFSPNRWFPFEGHGARLDQGRSLEFPVPLLPWLPARFTRRVMRARNYWPHELRDRVRAHGFEVMAMQSAFPQFEAFPWLPRLVIERYRRLVPRLERTPGIRRLGVSTFLLCRKTSARTLPGARGTFAAPSRYWEGVHRTRSGLAAVGYDGFGEPFNRWMYRLRRRVFFDAVAPHVADARRLDVLDVGSGSGFYLDLWQELGVERLTGSDVSPAAVSGLKGRYPALELLQFDIGGDPAQLPMQRFDVVSAFDVLFHIVDDERYRRAFCNLGLLIKPGGLLVFSEHFLRGGARRVSTVQKNRSLAEIERVLGDNGLAPLMRRRMFFLMNYPADSRDPLHVGSWLLLAQAITKWNRLGDVVGPVLYPIERALVARPKPGPSTDLMICRRTVA
jgi:2-polyprenyl-3-methyl-5-hydroxy-6-metoxy-1,4-benzoquinol methylase